jgi:hypothetical protein
VTEAGEHRAKKPTAVLAPRIELEALSVRRGFSSAVLLQLKRKIGARAAGYSAGSESV